MRIRKDRLLLNNGIKFFVKTVEIFLIPLVLLLIGSWIQNSISDKQEDLVVTQMVDSYLDSVTDHLSAPTELTSSVVIARTRALFITLQRLNRKEEIIGVLRFISEVYPEILEGDVFEQDPQSEKSFVDLSFIDLSNTSIKIFEIEGLRVLYANFSNTYFENFSCSKCGFSDSSFINVDFNDVTMNDSDFTGANFLGSNIESVDIEGSRFDRAIWSNGKVCGLESIGKCK